MSAPRQWLARFALAGVVLPVWFLGASLVFGALRPGYAPLRDAISELGEKGAPNALVWNIGGFGIVALLYGLYAIALHAGFGSGWLFRLGVLQAIFIAAGASLNCDPGCPPVPQTTTMLGHMIVGLAYFAINTVLPLVGWRTFRHRPEWRPYARPSLAAGVILVGFFFIGPILGEDRVGAWQRAVLVIAYAWQVAVALHLHAQLERPADVGGSPDQLAAESPRAAIPGG